MAAYLEKVEQSPFLNHVGFEIVEFDSDEPALKLTVKKDHHNINQSMHGGVHAAMLESLQSLVVQKAYQTKASVMNVNIHYLAPVSEGEILATARIIQKGYKIAMIESKLVDQNQQLIATGTGVYKIVRDFSLQT